MSADWKAGDKAVCIVKSWTDKSFICEGEPKYGVTYLVTGVAAGTAADGPSVGLYLAGVKTFLAKKRFFFFTVKNGEGMWDHRAFRKVVTATEQAEIEQEAKA